METKRGTTREVNGDLVLGGNSEHTIKNLRDPQAADEPVTLGYYESHGGGGGDASTWSQHPATQDVDMDGNKITGLGAPSAASDAATKGYVDARLPDLEWWDPVWTPYSNVNSVSNVECQYTRTYRAAGGSLVTLEGTIEVDIQQDNLTAGLFAPLPVPATSTGMLFAPAIAIDSSGVQTVCASSVDDFGSGGVVLIEANPLEDATGVPATLTIGFRISYRAA